VILFFGGASLGYFGARAMKRADFQAFVSRPFVPLSSELLTKRQLEDMLSARLYPGGKPS